MSHCFDGWTMIMGRLLRLLGLLILVPLSCAMRPEQYLAIGDEALTQGDHEAAIENYSNGIQALTDDESLLILLSLHTNLATAFSSSGMDQRAAAAYEQGLAAYQSQIGEVVDADFRRDATDIAAQAAFFLGMVYQDLDQSRDAVDAYTYAHALDPLQWAAMANLGAVYQDELVRTREALEAYQTAFAILTGSKEPTDPPPEPRYILSQLQYRIGLCLIHDATQKCQTSEGKPVDCNTQAAHAFDLATQYDPDHEAAKHMLATVTADATIERASNRYIQSLFDDYATNFEHSLVEELGYTGFERLRRGFDRALPTATMFDKVVDAGCGTGLVGEQFRNVSGYLIGVDLSEAILEEAVKARPALYNRVVVDDVTEVFRREKPIDLIVAADSYIYFGDLDPLFEAMSEGLRSGGYAAFTLENVAIDTEEALEESKPDWRWQLTASGRFAHRKGYVEATGGAHRMKVIHYEMLDSFRYERGVGVRGHLFVMQKLPRNDQEL